MINCPRCGKNATTVVIARDAQCSRCTAEDEAMARLRDQFAFVIVKAEMEACAREKAWPLDPSLSADRIWEMADALVKRRPK